MSDLFDFSVKVPRFTVMGNPIAHSKSPRIHQAFADQLGLTIEYDRTQVDIGGFAQALSHFIAHGGQGLNITVPFKIDACKRVDELSERAAQAQAVNTIICLEQGRCRGDNTDGIGLVNDIQNNQHITLHGKRVLLLGAGGAARGVCAPLLQADIKQLTISNRTLSKAQALAQQFDNLGKVTAIANDELEAQYEIIINATAASLADDLPQIPSATVGNAQLAYDMMYGDEPTAFLRWATQLGCSQVCDGLGMLVEQAAESFYLWLGQRPDTKPILKMLREA